MVNCYVLILVSFRQGCTEYSIRILFGPNSRPKSAEFVFVFGRIVHNKNSLHAIANLGAHFCCKLLVVTGAG